MHTFLCIIHENLPTRFHEDDKESGENSWLNRIVPAWKIIETLGVPTLREKQHARIEEWMQGHLPKWSPPPALNVTRIPIT